MRLEFLDETSNYFFYFPVQTWKRMDKQRFDNFRKKKSFFPLLFDKIIHRCMFTAIVKFDSEKFTILELVS